MASAVFPRQKPRFLPDINEKSSVKASLHGKEMKKPNRGSAERERIQTTTMNADEIAQFRYSLHQNLCVSMLQEGFHGSFKKFSSLLQRWKDERLAAGPDSELWLQRSLEEQPDKLEMLREHLTRAEAAQRADQFVEVYESHLALAKFFSEPEDMWLRHHFYKLGLKAARKVKTDSSRREAEASEHLAHLYLERGDLELAQEHFEMFHHLAVGQSWQDESGHTHLSRACESLCRVYTLLAQRQLQCGEYRAAIQLLNQAYEMAKEAGDKTLEGEAVYRVGLAYQSMGSQTTAKQFLNMFMEISTALGDMESLGKAYKAIAKSLESEDKISDAIEHLQKYLEVCQENNQHENRQDAYMCLGSIHISRAQYERGCEYFTQAFEMACSLDSNPCIEKAQLCVGIARAHSMLRVYTSHLQINKPPNVSTLISWKETKEDKFHETLCEFAGSTHCS
ncbi:tetratricopeptide repeat protein 29 isoform X1 [Ictalurus punctatus]|uniref:Tetratricopeptide repeat protein 29 n=2 Tax=Ictalurus punctatus TaxID=7998 RepID=A0A9F7RRE5_ICTPU|nr:tetratricopeptide repeat protein 29 isoform X1 [Ictalurus punctatus]